MNKKVILLISLTIIVLVILGVVFYYFYKSAQEKKIAKETLNFFKCASYCFEDKFNIEKDITYGVLNDVCYTLYCNSNYVRPEINTYLSNKNSLIYQLTEEIDICLGLNNRYMTKEEKQNCFNALFEKYKYIIDLSDFKMGNYQNYFAEITSLTCTVNETKVIVHLTEGDDATQAIYFIFTDQNGATRTLTKEPMKVGETKNYAFNSLDNIPNNLSSVAISIKVNGKVLGITSQKDC